MIILGIDPGTTRIGWGVIQKKGGSIEHQDHGCLFLKEYGEYERLVRIFDAVTDLILQYNPERVGVEKVFFSKNKKTAMAVSEARGVIITAIQKAQKTVESYAPNQIKQAVSTHGNANKKEVQKMVRLLLNLEKDPTPDDAADALAVAICTAHYSKK